MVMVVTEDQVVELQEIIEVLDLEHQDKVILAEEEQTVSDKAEELELAAEAELAAVEDLHQINKPEVEVVVEHLIHLQDHR
jgi:hypothetical protein